MSELVKTFGATQISKILKELFNDKRKELHEKKQEQKKERLEKKSKRMIERSTLPVKQKMVDI
jgi:hypothetical protein